MINPKLATGAIEVEVLEMNILNSAKALPFEIEEEKESQANEQIRLKYRFLDLRRERLQEIIKQRDLMNVAIREYFHANNFIDIQRRFWQILRRKARAIIWCRLAFIRANSSPCPKRRSNSNNY